MTGIDSPFHPGGAVVILLVEGGPDPFSEDMAMVAEFDALLLALDTRALKREGWDRLVAIIAKATIEAGDAEGGRSAYERALEQWRMSRHFDGHD